MAQNITWIPSAPCCEDTGWSGELKIQGVKIAESGKSNLVNGVSKMPFCQIFNGLRFELQSFDNTGICVSAYEWESSLSNVICLSYLRRQPWDLHTFPT